MKWLAVFIKGIKEQIRDYWILLMVVVMAPLFISIYFLMAETDSPSYEVIIVNLDRDLEMKVKQNNPGISLVQMMQTLPGFTENDLFNFTIENSREEALELLRDNQADVVVVIPGDFSRRILDSSKRSDPPAKLELVGDVTRMEYIVGAIWIEELINNFVLETAGIRMPIEWTETTLGYSGKRTMFEIYVPGLLILSIIMIIFSASAAIVREAETGTLERLKISRLSSFEFLIGLSLVQLIIAIVSLILALLTAITLGYSLIPGTLGFILIISVLTALSMISFSLIVAAMCRSIKDVAIIGTFPLFLLMFFTGAAFPISGGKLFEIGNHTVMLNDLLSPKFAVEALNKVLIRGLEAKDAVPEIIALMALTIIYFLLGISLFKRRHMRAL